MWIILNDAFLSIVENRDNPNELLVRSRLKQDIERSFPNSEVIELQDADYRYRTFVKREDVSDMLRTEVASINYDNFKNSVPQSDFKRINAYMNVWSDLRVLQKE